MITFKVLDKSQCLCEAFHNYFIESALDFSPPLSQRVDVAEYYKKITKHSTILLALDNKSVVGYCSFYANQVIGDFGKAGYLTSIHVHKNYRGHQVATKLLSMMCECLSNRGVRCVLLEVSVLNANAHKLYRSNGFSKINYRNDQPNSELITMIKTIIK